MPELPEVETTRLGIKPYIENQRISQLVVRERRLRWTIADEIDTCIAHQLIRQINRRGKYLLFELETGTLIIHLGMSGSLRVMDLQTPVQKHDHVDLILENGKCLRYHDPRRFGAIIWTKEPTTHPLLKHLGPEPLTENFTSNYLYEASRSRHLAVKLFIMDNKTVVGVGNIYANEALFAAGIHPAKATNTLTRSDCDTLVQCIKNTLQQAIKQGGTSLRDFVGGDGKPGYFQQQLQVYKRAGQACYQCGNTLQESRLGMRATVWCNHCQHK